MAINARCVKCGNDFITSAASHALYCENCDGSKERARAEADRWAALSLEQKVEELYKRIGGIQQRSRWDDLIG